MADQIRRVGLLKAVGATPGLVAAVLLAEYVVVALLASAAGLVIGSLTAPLLTEASAGLLGSVGAQTITLSTIGLVTAVALAVAVAATFVPAVRASRASTVLALADAARQPRRSAWLIAISARLPAPLLLGLRAAARRPRRTVLGGVSIAITVSGIVAALAAHADIADGSNTISGRPAEPGAAGDRDHAGRPRGRQRGLHHLGDGTRQQAFVGARTRARRHPAAGDRGTVGGAGAARARRRATRHPRRSRAHRHR